MSVTFQQELPIYKEVDVLVAGAGPAGVGAAVAAARNGADTTSPSTAENQKVSLQV